VPERTGRHHVLLEVNLQYTAKRADRDAKLSPQRLRLPPLAITVVTPFGLSAAQAKIVGAVGAGVSFAGTTLTG
jgi:hypothetical protein